MSAADVPEPLRACYARLEDDLLVLGTPHIERRWKLIAGLPHAIGFLDKRTVREWIGTPGTTPSIVPPRRAAPTDAKPTLTVTTDTTSPVHAPSLLATLAVGPIEYRFRVFGQGESVTVQLAMPAEAPAADPVTGALAADQPSGIETAHTATSDQVTVDLLDAFSLAPGHLKLIHVELLDQTDVHGNLAFEKTYYLDPAERLISLSGNLFAIEDILSGDGILFLKHAPLPHARPVQQPADLELRDAHRLALIGHGTRDGGEGYALGTIAYTGGKVGRIAALHAYQRQFRPYVSGRDGLLQSNTWGDRNRDARITDAFVRAEIEAGRALGVDIVQVDDGWQTGKTSNWADSRGGVWEGYWAVSKHFWQPNPQRFPNGLKPVVDTASRAGLRFGLWFSPDSSDDFAHWQDDANTLLTLHRDYGIRHFKIDGVKARTKAGERNLMRMFDKVLTETDGAVSFDLDVTAEVRPGYFGAMHVGPLFVENRYTDWRRYFPHHTLRTLWTLAHYVDPVRLRVEFLNNARNADKYGSDPLQPNRYRADYLFATVLFSSPLAWFEVSNLPTEFVQEAAPLIAEWKKHRDAIFTGRIIPVGDLPDGASWSGFVSYTDRQAHVLVFRGLNTPDDGAFDLPFLPDALTIAHRLGGDGALRQHGRHIVATGIEPLRFGWFVLSR